MKKLLTFTSFIASTYLDGGDCLRPELFIRRGIRSYYPGNSYYPGGYGYHSSTAEEGILQGGLRSCKRRAKPTI